MTARWKLQIFSANAGEEKKKDTNGQHFVTQVDDAQGQFVLSPGTDELAVETEATAVGLPRLLNNRARFCRCLACS